LLGDDAPARPQSNLWCLVPLARWDTVDALGLRLRLEGGSTSPGQDPSRLVGAADAAVKDIIAEGSTASDASDFPGHFRQRDAALYLAASRQVRAEFWDSKPPCSSSSAAARQYSADRSSPDVPAANCEPSPRKSALVSLDAATHVGKRLGPPSRSRCTSPSSDADLQVRDGGPFCETTRQTLPPWTCS
jgi:hypothetical protein